MQNPDRGLRIGELVAEFRSKQEAADAAGVAKNTINNWISGGDPNLDALLKLCDARDASLEWVARGGDRSQLQPVDQESTDLDLLADVIAIVARKLGDPDPQDVGKQAIEVYLNLKEIKSRLLSIDAMSDDVWKSILQEAELTD